MGIDRNLKNAKNKMDRKEWKEMKKKLKKEAKDLKKEAKERAATDEQVRSETAQLQDQIAVTAETGNSLSDIANESEEDIITHLLDFRTYGQLREKLLRAKFLFQRFSDTKKHKLSEAGKKGCEQVKRKAKEWLELAKAWEKRISKTNSPSAPIATAEFPYKEEMRRYQRALIAMEHDRAAGFTGRLETLALYPTNSTEYIQKGEKEIRHLAPYKNEINRLLGTRAAAEALDDKLDYAHQFLEHAVEGSFTQQDMIFYNMHGATMRDLCNGTDLSGMIDETYRRCSITPEDYRRECSGDVDLRGMSFTDSLKRGSLHGGVSWLLQQGKMPPQSASNWANLASLAALGFAGYELFKGAKKMGGGGFWGTTGSLALLLAGGQLLSQFTTGKGLIDNVKGLLWGGDNMVSGMIDLFSKRTGGNNTDVQSCVGGANQQFFENYYRTYDRDNHLLALPLLFPNTTLGGLQQQIQQFKNNPSQWDNFHSNAMRMYGHTIPGAIINTHCSGVEALESWLNSLPLPLSDRQRQNEKLDDIVFESVINECLKDKGYEVALGYNVKQLVQYVKMNCMEDPGKVFDKLKGANLITPKTTVDSEDDKGEDERLKTILTNKDSLKNYLSEKGYQLKDGTTLDKVKEFFQQEKQQKALKETPDDDQLPLDLLNKAEPPLIEQVNYSDPDIGTLKTTCSNVLDGLGDKKDTYWNAIENLAKNTSKDSGIELKQGEDGKFIFCSYGKETSIDWKKLGIVGFNKTDSADMLVAGSEDEVIQTAHLVNRAKQWLDNHPKVVENYLKDNAEKHPEYHPIKIASAGIPSQNKLRIAGTFTEILIPDISYITKNSEPFCSFLQAYALQKTGS